MGECSGGVLGGQGVKVEARLKAFEDVGAFEDDDRRQLRAPHLFLFTTDGCGGADYQGPRAVKSLTLTVVSASPRVPVLASTARPLIRGMHTSHHTKANP